MTKHTLQGSRRPSRTELERFIELIGRETSGQVDGRGGYR